MKGVAVPVVLHVVLQGTLRNVKGVAVPVVLHVVLHAVLQGHKKREETPEVGPALLHTSLQG